MIPNADQIQFVAQMSKGDLAEVPFPVLLHAFAVGRRSAVLSIERRQLKKEIILENGIPVDCHSNLLQDTLGKFMVDRGDITDEQCQLSLGKSATSGVPVSEILVSEGWVSAEKLFKILQLNLAKKLLDAFTWKSGDFVVSSELPKVESPLKVKTPQLVLTGIAKFAPTEEVEQAMHPFLNTKLFLNPQAPYSLKELRFSTAQQQLVGSISLGRSLEELHAETGIERSTLLRTLYALSIIGTVVPEAWLPVSRETGEAMVVADPDFDAPAAEIPETSPQAPAGFDFDPAERRNEVMETYLRYRKQDAFELLGLEEDAAFGDVENAYLDYCEKYGPWLYVGDLSNMQEKARDLFIAGGRAFGELMNPETRNSLLGRRKNKIQELSNQEARDAFKIKSNLLDAETQFKRGIALMKSENYRDAIEQLAFAFDCEPQNSIYRSELAFCRYRLDPEIQKDKTLNELRESIRIDPECGLAMYYLGVILGEASEFEEAEPYLQKAIKLMKPDRRPIDALKQFKVQAKDKPKKRLFF